MSLLSTLTNASINGWRSTSVETSYLQQVALEPSTIAANYRFGYACAISGDNNYCTVSGNPAGGDPAIYMFKNNNDGTWTQQVRFAGGANQLAINATGDYVVAGYTGSIRIYIRSGSTWTLQQTITGVSEFGRFCAIDSTGTRIVTSNYTNNSDRGALYVYKRTGTSWALEATLIATGAAVGDTNGLSVTINDDGSYIASGAPNFGATDAGAVYVFTRSGTSWSQQQRITGFTIAQTGDAARVMSINGDGTYLMFSAPASGNPSGIGYTHIYIRTGSTWTLQQTLSQTGLFGWAVSINNAGNIAIINASADTTYTGKVYVYNRVGTAWNLIQSVITTPSQTNANFTERNALDINDLGTWFIGGATDMNTFGTNSGTAFIFSNT